MNPSSYQKTKEDFKTYMKSKQFSRQSIDSRMVMMNQYWNWLELENLEAEQVTYNDLLLFMKHCQHTGKKQKTIQHYLIVVKHFYDHLIREERITINPASDIIVKGVKRKILYHILEAHELHELYNKYDDESLKGKRNKVMLGLLIYQGLQTEELTLLEIDHIKLREGKLDVPGGIRRNGRLLQLESHQVMDVYDYILQTRPKIIEASKQETEKLLISPAGGTEVSNFMSRMMLRLKAINPSVLNAKQIRASVITKWLKIYNLREVQYLAGHKYISSTEGYLHNDMEGLKEEVQQFHPLG